MEKQFVVIGFFIGIVVITVIFGKVIGPKLLDWIAQRFNKATDKLDNAIMGKPDEWETKVREIVEAKPEQLKQRVANIFLRFAEPKKSDFQPEVSLPPSARNFFEKYSQLSFDGQTKVLDVSAVRIVTHKARQYVVIGRSEDDGHFYAVDLHDNVTIVRIEMDDTGKVFSMEDDAPSFEHFVTLQHELHLKSAQNRTVDVEPKV
jgi:hypothetical protein